MSPVGAKLFGYNLAIGGNMGFPYTFFFSFLVKTLCTSTMVDYHLMGSRYSGLYHNTLKLLDSNNKKEVRLGSKKKLPSRSIF